MTVAIERRILCFIPHILMGTTNGWVYFSSPQFCQLCVRVFDRQSKQTMKLDDFIQCCVMLKTLTDKFRAKDTQMQGVININYEEVCKIYRQQPTIFWCLYSMRASGIRLHK